MLPLVVIVPLIATLLTVLLTLAFIPRRYLGVAATLLTIFWAMATCAVVLLETISAGWTDGAPRRVNEPRLFVAVLIPGITLIWSTVIIRTLWRARRRHDSALPVITGNREAAQD